jgi:hypothetical protein
MSALLPANVLLPRLRKQRGAVLMVMLVILIVGIAALLVSSLNSTTLLAERSNITSIALAQAKEGLIGRAVTDGNHPGSLPCPDISNNGTAPSTVGQPGLNCPSYIGRLPWKSLGLPDLRDESGERLWYALSPNYRDSTGNTINSNTVGTLQIYDNSGTTLLTPAGYEAAAIVFAPGVVIGSQLRGDLANQNLPSNYLDIGPNNINNSNLNGPFIAADKASSFNDRLMIIKTRDIISIVEKRASKDLTTAFASYFASYGKYPNPANFSSCTSVSTCPSDNTVCLGKIPLTAITTYLPNTWFAGNKWFDVVYYTAGTSFMSGGMGMGCSTTLNFSGVNSKGLFIMPGVPVNGIVRATSLDTSSIASYIEDIENQNLDANYVTPSANSNDSLHILP